MGVFKKHGVYWIDHYASGHRKRGCIGLDKQEVSISGMSCDLGFDIGEIRPHTPSVCRSLSNGFLTEHAKKPLKTV